MTPEEFAYWIQGAIEMSPDMLEKGMTPQQVKTIQDHLDLVFNKVTPDRFEDKTTIRPMTLKEIRIMNSSPSTGPSLSNIEEEPKLFCSNWMLKNNISNTAMEAGKHGLVC